MTLWRPSGTKAPEVKDQLAPQIVYWSAVPWKNKPYNAANWESGTEHAYGFPTYRDAWMIKGEYKDASGIEEKYGGFT